MRWSNSGNGEKKIFLGCLLLCLFGCRDKEEEYIRIENNLRMYETAQMLADSIMTIQENIDAVEKEEKKIEPWGRTILSGTFSREMAIENCEPGMFDDYEELIETLSEAFLEGTIEEKLLEMKHLVEILSEEEKNRLIENDTYGRLKKLVNTLSYQKTGNVNWYLVEQTNDRKDVIIQKNNRETGFVTYDTFKCDVKKNRTLWAYVGLRALAESEEHLFIKYNGLKYLCTPKRNEEGKI